MYTAVEVQRDIYVQCGRHICSGAEASNVTCITVILVTLLIVVILMRYIY